MKTVLSVTLVCLLGIGGTVGAWAEEAPQAQNQSVSEAPAPAGDAVDNAKEEKTAATDTSDKVRCKRMVVTGSRLGKSVCHTEEEWAAMERAAKEAMRDYDANSRTQPTEERMREQGWNGG